MMMKLLRFLALFFLTTSASAFQLSMSNTNHAAQSVVSPRRAFLSSTLTVSATILSFNQAAVAEEQDYSVAPNVSGEPDADGFITTESGLKYKTVKEGTGAVPMLGETVKAHYTGWLDGFDSEKKFDSSRYVKTIRTYWRVILVFAFC